MGKRCADCRDTARPCSDCRGTAAERRYRERGRTHGKASTYDHGGCRCQACSDAAKAYRHAQRTSMAGVHGSTLAYPARLKACHHPTWATCPKCRPDRYPALPVRGEAVR